MTNPSLAPLSNWMWACSHSWRRLIAQLAGGRHVERLLDVAVGVGVHRRRVAAGVEGEPVASTEHAEEVVERVVLHHQDHDVLDPGHGGVFGPCWCVRVVERTRDAEVARVLTEHPQCLELLGRQRGRCAWHWAGTGNRRPGARQTHRETARSDTPGDDRSPAEGKEVSSADRHLSGLVSALSHAGRPAVRGAAMLSPQSYAETTRA